MALSKKVEPYVVMDLGSHSIKILLGIYDGLSMKVKKALRVEIPDGAYYDGKINDAETMAALVSGALKSSGIKEKRCIVTFNSKDVIQKELSLPELSYEDTVGLIRYEISQYLPIDIDEYDIAYKNISKKAVSEVPAESDGEESSKNEDSEDTNINVISYIVKKELVDDLHAFVLACGLEPVFLDFHSNSISKFVKHVNDAYSRNVLDSGRESSTIALIDLGHKNILIDIVEDDAIVLSRIVDIGFLEQDKLIAQRFGIDIKEAEKLRHEKFTNRMVDLYYIYEKVKNVVFDGQEVDKAKLGIGEGYATQEEIRLFSFLGESMVMYDEAVAEISKVLQYYTNRKVSNKIDRVLLYGAAVCDGSMLEFFDMILDFKVELVDFNKIANIDFAGNVSDKSAYVNALGALVRYREG